MGSLGTLHYLEWLTGTARVRVVRGFSTATGALAARSGGGVDHCSPRVSSFGAMSGWVCLSRRIRVISRVNAAGFIN